MTPVERLVLFVSALVWGGGALLFALTWRAPDRSKFRRLWMLEVLQVSAIFVPAILGGAVCVIVYSLLALRAAFELSRCMHRESRLAKFAGLGVVLAGFAVAVWSSRQHLSELLFAYAVIEVTDTAAWAVGSALGKHKAFPALSPNKTWEGLVAGVCAAALSAALLQSLLPDRAREQWLLQGLALGVLATIGDLLASWVKRRAGVKNYSELIPHQGGVLDLYDSFVVALPLWFVGNWLQVVRL